MIRSILILLFSASLFLSEGRAAYAQVTYSMTLFSEYNVDEVVVGSGQSMGVAAVVTRSDNNLALTGQTMTASLENVQGNWGLSSNWVQANGCGQGHLYVSCQGHGDGDASSQIWLVGSSLRLTTAGRKDNPSIGSQR